VEEEEEEGEEVIGSEAIVRQRDRMGVVGFSGDVLGNRQGRLRRE